ncbi:MAG: alpha/beta hydrolase [Isosphaeraceae bacterium]
MTRPALISACALCLLPALAPDLKAADPEPKPSPVLIGGRYEVDVRRDIPYVEGPGADPRKQKLDLYLPRGKTEFPVLFFVHGGGWTTGDRKLYAPVGRLFARNGVGAVVVSYRLTPQVTHPGHIEDVASAFAWTYKHIKDYGGRPDRIFVTGQSAGGHLSALLATNPTYLKPYGLTPAVIRGAMPVSGIYDVPPGRLRRIVGFAPNAAQTASPVRHISGKEPPFLILYADRDFPSCARMSEDFHAALTKAGVPAEIVEVKDRNHISIMLRLMLDEADPVTQQLLAFVAKHSEMTLTPRTEPAGETVEAGNR